MYQKYKYINNRVRAFMLGITHGEAVCLCYIFLKYAYEKLIQISIKQNRVICIKNKNDCPISSLSYILKPIFTVLISYTKTIEKNKPIKTSKDNQTFIELFNG